MSSPLLKLSAQHTAIYILQHYSTLVKVLAEKVTQFT